MASPLAGVTQGSEQTRVRDSYGLALAALLASVLMLIAAGVPMVSYVALVAVALQFIALTLTLRVSGVSRQRFRVGLFALGIVLAASLAAALFGGDSGAVVSVLGWALIVTAAIVAVALRLRTYRVITLQFVLGLLCVYLLIGLWFGLAYQLVILVKPLAFGSELMGISGAVYYSFITLATVGYGDITPVAPVARSMAVGEAILGQLYLVSVVSLAVSRLGSGRKRLDDAEETG